MDRSIHKNPASWLIGPVFKRILILFIFACLCFIALIFPIGLQASSSPFQVGHVAVQDIQAPNSLSYKSEILTEKARKDTEQSVASVFLPADPAITRRQIEKLQLALNFITTVRSDSYSTREQKLSDLSALEFVTLTKDVGTNILDLSEPGWQAVQKESLSVLEQVMRNTVREDRLTSSQKSVTTLISYTMSQDQAAIVTVLVTPFVVPNSLFSQELTDKAKNEAKAAIQPVTRSYVVGETIVRRGQIITAETYEALQKFNMLQTSTDPKNLLADLTIIILVSLLIFLYYIKRRNTPIYTIPSIILVAATFLVFLYGARILIINRTVTPFIYPIPAFGLTIASLYSMEIGLIFTLILSVLAGFGLPQSLDYAFYYFISTLVGILILSKGRRVSSFFWAGIAVGGAGSAIIVAYRIIDTDWIGIATLIGAAFLNGLASASLTLLFQHFFAQLLGITTTLQLLDISRPDHPLLHYLLTNAPGTYQHSLQVANISERAAEAIGADALLTRVGAIFHDAGKAVNPSFFIENIVPGQSNPHNHLDPITSSSIIIQHIADSVQLAKKYHIPPRIQDFMREHHGTLVTRYQYAQAVQAAGNQPEFVNMELFRYPGPTPRSRETALLMLADICEARARAELPADEEELRILVKKVFEFCQQEGQLDNTTFTMRDLHFAVESFVNTLQNTHHLRIKYPKLAPVVYPSELPKNAEPNPEPVIVDNKN